MAFSETKLLDDFVDALDDRIPSSWRLPRRRRDAAGADLRLNIKAPDGKTAQLVVEAKRTIEPRDVASTAAALRELAADKAAGLVATSYASPRVRELLSEEGIGYWDETGNFRLALDSPALFIDVSGADKNPAPDSRSLQSLRGRASARAVRALCDLRPPYGIRELAERADVSAASLSRVIELLDREAIVERESSRGPIVRVDWQALLRRWARDYDFAASNATAAYLEPRGLPALLDKLRKSALDYAITGTLAADALGAAATAPRLATVYVEDREQAGDALGLRRAETGANVLLAEPFDPVAFERTSTKKNSVYAAASQVAVDLLTGPGRGPADGEALITWMQENENAWRA